MPGRSSRLALSYTERLRKGNLTFVTKRNRNLCSAMWIPLPGSDLAGTARVKPHPGGAPRSRPALTSTTAREGSAGWQRGTVTFGVWSRHQLEGGVFYWKKIFPPIPVCSPHVNKPHPSPSPPMAPALLRPRHQPTASHHPAPSSPCSKDHPNFLCQFSVPTISVLPPRSRQQGHLSWCHHLM